MAFLFTTATAVPCLASITSIAIADFDSPRTLDFESASDGPISGSDPLFTSVGISSVTAVGADLSDIYDSGFGLGRALFPTPDGLQLLSPGLDPFFRNTRFTFEFAQPQIRFGVTLADHSSGVYVFEFFSGAISLGNPGTFIATQDFSLRAFESTTAFDRVTIRATDTTDGFGIDSIILEPQSLNAVAIPEPSTLLLTAFGLVSLATVRPGSCQRVARLLQKQPVQGVSLAVTFAAALGSGQATIAGVIFSQPLTSAPAAQFGTHSNFPNGGSQQQVADRFTLLADTDIETILWFGNHDVDLPPGTNTSFLLRLFSDSGGTSPGVILEERSVTSNSTSTGLTQIAGLSVFSYEATFTSGISLDAGSYWLSILESDEPLGTNNWSWQRSDTGEAATVFRRGEMGPWQSVSAANRLHRAFTLLEATAIPEPSTWLLVAVGLLGLTCRRKWMCVRPCGLCHWMLALLLVACTTSGESRAGTIAVQPSSSGSNQIFGPFSGAVGWRFTVNVPIIVTDLGTFDRNSNGISSAPTILWTDFGAPLASTTLTSGSALFGPTVAGPGVSGRFRYNPIPRVTLNPGTYRIGSGGANQWVQRVSVSGAGSEITLDSRPWFRSGSPASFPGTPAGTGANFGFFGPNFQYDVAAISGSPGGGTINVGNVEVGGSPIAGGTLAVENTGDASTFLILNGFSGLGGGFSLASGNAGNRLFGNGVNGSGNDIENFVFQFDPTGLSEGVYTTNILLSSSHGTLNYTLSATVGATAVPEPSTWLLVAAGFWGFIFRRQQSGRIRLMSLTTNA